LRNKTYDDFSKSHFKLESKTNRMTKIQQRRSPEEFQVYLKGLFDNSGPIYKYHWYFAARKKRKNRYCGINS
jgi:hypothetical protein